MSTNAKRALISVSDKSKLESLITSLSKHGYEFISSGGTAKHIKELGFDVTEISEITEFPEILDGRVKTLHPKIYGGLLAKQDNEEHIQQVKDLGIKHIDLLIVNLYPFEQVANELKQKISKETDHQNLIENIDIGGPCLIRAAAKNHKHTTVIHRINQYEELLSELQKNNGVTSLEYRQRLALEAFAYTSQYDAIISNTIAREFSSLAKQESSEENIKEELLSSINANDPFHLLNTNKLNISTQHQSGLRYGENPHQKAALFRYVGDSKAGIANAKQLQGKELSFNNLLDLDAAWNLVQEFEEAMPCVAIIKHNNPCGIAIAPSISQAFQEAFACDTMSAFGGIVASNQTIDLEAANEMTQIFLEAIIAPAYTEEALKIFSSKKNLRVIQTPNINHQESINEQNIESLSLEDLARLSANKNDISNFDIKTIAGGLLVQEKNQTLFNPKEFKVVSKKKIEDDLWIDLLFAWKTVKHCKSNAIVTAHNGRTLGIGAGQTSRVKAVEDALKSCDMETRGAVLASDAFFPFADSIHLAAQNHISAIIQPGGSIKDKEVIQACDDLGIAMVFTNCRHFKH